MSDKNPSRSGEFPLGTPVRLAAVAVAACFLSAPALSNPANPTVVNGTASFNHAGNVLTVTNSNGAIINWDKFSIKAGETTHFAQTSASSSVLNRVLANDPSTIYGTLSSNGRVWLVNPAGIMVGAGGRVDVAGFVASTLNISNENFLAGKKLFDATAGAGSVVNQGSITTPSGGSVYLVGPNVTNEGIITTPQGETILAAGQTVSLIDSATPGVKVDITGAEGNVTNLGSVVAEAGRIGMAGVLVKNSGSLNASSVVSDGGRIFLKATGDTLVEGGKLAATSAGGKGGQVDVLGGRVAVLNDAEIDVSGATGGGRIRIGGDYQGKSPDIQNASITYFGKEAILKADALEVGDGGTVIVWGDDTTRAYGHIFARGGTAGGNGGFVETSGHRYLDFQGIVDTGAAMGTAGTLLLDPADIIIDNSTDNLAGGSFSGGWFSGATTNATLTWATINAQSGNLEVRTNSAGTGGNGDIIINAGGSVTGPTSLILLANRHVNFGPGVAVSAGSANVNLIAGWNNTGWAVTPGTGLVTLGTGAALTTTTGNLYIYSGNGLTVQSGASINVGGILDIGTLANPVYGNVMVNGSILSSGSAQNVYSSGTVSVQATNTGFAAIAYSGSGTQTIQGSSVVLAGENFSGGSSHSAQISSSNAASTQSITATAGGILVTGGGYMGVGINNSASIYATGSQTISATGALTLLGGDGADNNWAYLYSAGNQSVTAASMALTGGINGNRAGTYIRGDGDQHLVTTAGGITLTAAATGTHFGGYATIVHGPTSGNQLIEISGGNLTALGGGGTGLATGVDAPPLIAASCTGACISPGVSANYAGINNRIGTTTLDMNGGAVSLQGGSGAGSTANQAYYSNGSTGAQTILNAGAITLTGGASGGNDNIAGDGFHYLRNNATIFSPLGAQNITATSMVVSSSATAATGSAGAAVYGKGQTISLGTGVLTLTAGNTNAGGGAVVIQSTAGQTITAGATTITGGGGGYDNSAAIKQTGGAGAAQILNFDSLTIAAGSGSGTGGDTGDCSIGCPGHAASNTAGIFNAGANGQTVNILAGNLIMNGGSNGNRNVAYIQNRSASLQTIDVSGNLTMQGGDSGGENSSWLYGQSNAWGGSWLSNSASITSGWSGGVIGSQDISAGVIQIRGNSGAGTGMGGAGFASTGSQTVSGAAINLYGGAGTGSSENGARIVSLASQNITANSLGLTAGATGIGNNARVSAYGQSIILAGTTLSLLGGGSTASDFSNTAEIVNYGGSGQFITISPGSATVTITGGAGSGVNPLGSNECGALCDSKSSWNTAQIRNESGNQTLDLSGGSGSIVITGGSVGNDNYAGIQNKTAGTQTILGSPSISLLRGASGGVVAWGQQQVATPEHALGSWRWFEMTNDAGIHSDGGQTIAASAITLNSSAGTAYGGTFITGKTQNITASGVVTLTGGSEAIAAAITGPSMAPVIVPSGTATEFLFVAPAVIGNDSAGHSLNLSVGSLNLSGGGYGAYGGSPTLIGTYKNATNTVISSSGPVMFTPASAGSVQVGSFFGNGGSLSITNSSAGLSFGNAWVGTGASGMVALSAAGGSFSQVSGGKLSGHDVSIAMGGGSVAQLAGAVIQATNLNVSGNILSAVGDNLASNVILVSTGAGGSINYNTATDTHLAFAMATTGNIDVTSTSASAASIALGTVTASGGNVTITADRAILDDNGSGVTNITAGTTSLVSSNGGASGGLAISADVKSANATNATVTGGSTYGGIRIWAIDNMPGGNMNLTDGASNQPSIGFYYAGSIANPGIVNLNAGAGGSLVFAAGGDLTGTPNILSAPVSGGLILAAGGTLSLPGSFGSPSYGIGLLANNVLIDGPILGKNITLGAGSLTVGSAGGLAAVESLVGVVSGNATINGGYIRTTAGDLELLVGGNLNINDGGYLWAGYGQMSPVFRDASIAVGGNLTLNNHAHINAANDIFIDLLGANSTLAMNNGPLGPSYILSDIGTAVMATTYVTFLTRSSGGIVIDGVETTKTVVGGSGFFAVDTSKPALPGAGLEITFAPQANDSIAAQLVDAINRATDDVDPSTTPTDSTAPQSFEKSDSDKTAGGTDGGFGGDEEGSKDDKKEDKDKKKSEEGKDGKKDEKPAQKKVAQCT